MKILSSKFIKGIVQDDKVMDDGTPQVAFIGRSNVGKSSLINALTKSKVSRTSSTAGRTQEINFFLINDAFYFVDLPGYGFAKISDEKKGKLSNLMSSYLFNDVYTQKNVVLIVDCNVGMTDKDIEMFENLRSHNKNIVIALSKKDKATQAILHKTLSQVKGIVGSAYPIFPISSTKGAGIDELVAFLLS
jgi:GTP-binding protein